MITANTWPCMSRKFVSIPNLRLRPNGNVELYSNETFFSKIFVGNHLCYLLIFINSGKIWSKVNLFNLTLSVLDIQHAIFDVKWSYYVINMLCGGIKPQKIRPSNPGTTCTETVYDFKMFKPNSKMEIISIHGDKKVPLI